MGIIYTIIGTLASSAIVSAILWCFDLFRLPKRMTLLEDSVNRRFDKLEHRFEKMEQSFDNFKHALISGLLANRKE